MTARLETLVLLAAGALVVGGCSPHDPPRQGPLVVLVSGDTAGWIVPCGCATAQFGGLPRRASYVEQVEGQAAVVLCDVGGAPGGTSPYDVAKFEAIVKGETAMGIAAHNIGQAEARLGAQTLRQLAGQHDLPLVSANVRDAAGQLVAEPLRVVEAGGRRVALVGVLSPSLAPDDLEVTPPQQAVLDALDTKDGPFDAVIVLAYLPEEELESLFAGLPEVDVVVGGPTRTGQNLEPRRRGRRVLLSATNKGKFLARLDAPPDSAGGFEADYIALDETLPDDPGQLANLRQFYEGLARRDFRPHETGLVSELPPDLPQDYRVAGTASCRECHDEEYKVWADSRHAHAWDSLAEKGAHVDPYCQQCHATGYGLPGGFVSVSGTPERTGVGCEDCHGPSEAHRATDTVRTPYFERAAGQCIRCHDRENSPQFDYETYWPKIEHGIPATAESDADAKEPEEDLNHVP